MSSLMYLHSDKQKIPLTLEQYFKLFANKVKVELPSDMYEENKKQREEEIKAFLLKNPNITLTPINIQTSLSAESKQDMAEKKPRLSIMPGSETEKYVEEFMTYANAFKRFYKTLDKPIIDMPLRKSFIILPKSVTYHEYAQPDLEKDKEKVAKKMITEGKNAEGEKAEEEKAEGEKAEGEKAEGEKTEGEKAEGEIAEGEIAGRKKARRRKSKGKKAEEKKTEIEKAEKEKATEEQVEKVEKAEEPERDVFRMRYADNLYFETDQPWLINEIMDVVKTILHRNLEPQQVEFMKAKGSSFV